MDETTSENNSRSNSDQRAYSNIMETVGATNQIRLSHHGALLNSAETRQTMTKVDTNSGSEASDVIDRKTGVLFATNSQIKPGENDNEGVVMSRNFSDFKRLQSDVLDDATDSDIDDEDLRSVDAFSSDEDIEFVDGKSTGLALSLGDNGSDYNRLRASAPMRFQTVRRGSIVSKKSLALSKMTYLSQRSKMSKAEIKLAEAPDQPLKGMIYYILYTLLYSVNFLLA